MLDVMRGTYEHSSAKFVFRSDSSNHFGNHFGERYGDDVGLWVAAMAMSSWYPECAREIRNRGGIFWLYGWDDECMSIRLPLHASLTQPVMCFMRGATGFCSFWNAVSWGDDYLRAPAVNGGQTLFYPGTGLSPDPTCTPRRAPETHRASA
jgi:hypothetical protein